MTDSCFPDPPEYRRAPDVLDRACDVAKALMEEMMEDDTKEDISDD